MVIQSSINSEVMDENPEARDRVSFFNTVAGVEAVITKIFRRVTCDLDIKVSNSKRVVKQAELIRGVFYRFFCT